MNLSKMTVKELKSIAQDMGMPFTNRVLKADLISAIEENIEKAHTEALTMNEPTYTIPGTDTVLKGDLARVMIYHMTNVHRFNPTEKRDKNNRVILTPKQQRRCSKKLRKYTYKTLSIQNA